MLGFYRDTSLSFMFSNLLVNQGVSLVFFFFVSKFRDNNSNLTLRWEIKSFFTELRQIQTICAYLEML